jgi:hypothetical protein
LADPSAHPVVTGYSFRSQCQRFGDRTVAHPAQVLRDRLVSSPLR